MDYLFFTGNQGNQPIRRYYCFMAGLLLLTNTVILFQLWPTIFMSSHQTTPVLGIPICLVRKEFTYTFDRLSEIIEDFLKAIGFTHFGLFMQDYGGAGWLQDHISSSRLARMAYNTEYQCLRGWFYQSLGWIPQCTMEESVHRRRRAPYLHFYNMKLSSKYIYTVTRIQRILAPIIGIWISGSWNILLCGKYRWICFMTIVLTFHCIHSGRNSYVNVNPKR